MSSTNSTACHRARPPTSPKKVFSGGRRVLLRNTQHPTYSGSFEVKWDSKRRPQPMANHASGMRPSPIETGAHTPVPLSRIPRFDAALTHLKGGRS